MVERAGNYDDSDTIRKIEKYLQDERRKAGKDWDQTFIQHWSPLEEVLDDYVHTYGSEKEEALSRGRTLQEEMFVRLEVAQISLENLGITKEKRNEAKRVQRAYSSLIWDNVPFGYLKVLFYERWQRDISSQTFTLENNEMKILTRVASRANITVNPANRQFAFSRLTPPGRP